jgi:hypothetical protein
MSFSDNIRTSRWVKTANLILQAILIITLFAGLNYLAGIRSNGGGVWRVDLTRYRRYTLSPETNAYLRDLASPVRIVVTLSADATPDDLKGLLREYVDATTTNLAGGHIQVEYIDIDLARREAQLLGLEQPNLVRMICGDKSQTVSVNDLYQYVNQERRAFKGEQIITASILDVAREGRKRIYFIYGHSELMPDDTDSLRGLSLLNTMLRERNFDISSLDLSRTHKIPEDASLLIAVQPQSRFSNTEQEILRHYLANDEGRLILMLSPGYSYGLERLVSDWGIIVDDDFLRDQGADNITEDGDLIINSFDLKHPVTQGLLHSSYKARLRLGPARTVRLDMERAQGLGLAVTTLASSSTTAWGQLYAASRASTLFNSKIDIKPGVGLDTSDRLGIAAASEKVGIKNNLPFSVPTGRLIVFGSGDLVANTRVTSEGVFNLFIGAVNWMVDRDTQLNIPSRPIDRFQLLLSPRELQNLRYCLIFALPGAAALMGLIVYWTRRS